jgi:hypothetical protein
MRFAILAAVLFSSLSSASWGRVTKNSSRVRSVDPIYSSALAAANRFLQAWQTQDHESGIIMLTDSARQQTSPESLQSFFSPGAQAAYEIAHGRRISSGGYSFPVVLFGVSANSPPHYGKIVVTRDGKDEWAIDRVP